MRARWLIVTAGVSVSTLTLIGAQARHPRTPDGHPDLQGTYDVATLTPLERPAGQPLVLTDEDAAKLERQVADRKFRAGLPSRGDRDAPPVGGDASTGAAGNVGGYNNLHRIVQTPDSVVILNEMVHDARVVRMNVTPVPPAIRTWMGDSVGRWDGDTLVVDTTNFTDTTRFRGSTERLHVVERFTRVDAKTLLYRFTIEDPSTWTAPWTGEYTWPATDEHVYEYACHEGNYALGNILRGARLKEANASKK